MLIASIHNWRHSCSALAALTFAVTFACSSNKDASKDASSTVTGGSSANVVVNGGSASGGHANGGSADTSRSSTSNAAGSGGIQGSITAVLTGGTGVSTGTAVSGGTPSSASTGTNVTSSGGAGTSTGSTKAVGGTGATSATGTKAVGGTSAISNTNTKAVGGTGATSTTGTKAAGGTGGTTSGVGGTGGTAAPTSTAAPSDIILPVPRITDDAHPVLEALSKRQSTREFSTAELSSAQQSEIVWAAFGINRPAEGKRTAPSAWNCQDIDPYLVTSAGVFKYNAPAHALDLVSSTDVRSQLGSPYSTAPLTLVYVSSQSKISSTDKTRYSYLHTGLIGMNVYLYAAYENLPVVIRDSAPSGFTQSLNLTSDQVITLVQTIGLASGQSNANGVPFQAGSLVAPRTSTHPILKALMNRKSASGFAAAALTDQVLGEILWSGFGVNRPDGKRTAPSANNGQDVDIYALMASGAYRYDATNHALRLVSATDARSLASTAYASAPLTLVLVSNYAKISASLQERYASADTGFIAQNVYAYCASEGLSARVYESVANSNSLQTTLQLTNDQHMVLIQTVGPNP